MFRLEFADKTIEMTPANRVLVGINTSLALAVIISLPCQAATEFNFTIDANQYNPAQIELNPVGASLLSYSTICVSKNTFLAGNKSSIQSNPLARPITSNNDGLSRETRESIHLLLTDKQLSGSLTPINNIALDQLATDEFIINGTTSASDDLYGGSALNELVRLGLKSWWKNNEGSQLHNLHESAPESIRTGKMAGKVKYDWDYSLKVSHNDVKLKLEKAF